MNMNRFWIMLKKLFRKLFLSMFFQVLSSIFNRFVYKVLNTVLPSFNWILNKKKSLHSFQFQNSFYAFVQLHASMSTMRSLCHKLTTNIIIRTFAMKHWPNDKNISILAPINQNHAFRMCIKISKLQMWRKNQTRKIWRKKYSYSLLELDWVRCR